MKVIKYALSFIVIVFLLATCNNNEDRIFTEGDSQFVRFFLLVDNDNNALEYPQVNGGLIPVENYTYKKFLPLKIPVALTATNIQEPINVDFSSEISNNLEGVTIEPQNQLTFTNEKLVDTIQVTFKVPWNDIDGAFINFQLNQVNNQNIQIGSPNANLPNDKLTINFDDVDFIYTFEKSRQEIAGNQGETFDFNVLFPNGFVKEEIDGNQLFSTTSTFNFSTVQLPITSPSSVTFRSIINDNLDEDIFFNSLLNLADITERYTQGAISCFQVSKPVIAEREGNPAENFYNVNDPFFRLRGDYWRVDNDIAGACEWFGHNVFSVPVTANTISEDDVINWIQISGQETPDDASDDLFHHRFKIGFVSPNAPLGTNPFALRNLLLGESLSSPGFNIVEALEFFPEDGNNTAKGTVNVIPQKLAIIRTNDDAVFNISVNGTGTYELIDETTNLWRIAFEVTYDFNEIDGSIHTIPIVLHNQAGQPEPPLSSSNCFDPIQL